MPLPGDTVVTFPAGSVEESATVLDVRSSSRGIEVVTEATPFHPVDRRWPDQGADAGELRTSDGRSWPVIDCLIGATDGAACHVGEMIPVRRGEPGWWFQVIHVLPTDARSVEPGDRVELRVDPVVRRAVSAGHTGCHVAAVALNSALASRWHKDAPRDGLGNPDFDQLAIASSLIRAEGCTDVYRIGKSLRRRGFDASGLTDELADVQAAVNATLLRWLTAGATSEVVADGPGLTDRRTWVCSLPDGEQRIACGGTHLRSLGELAELTVRLVYDEVAGVLQMETTARLEVG